MTAHKPPASTTLSQPLQIALSLIIALVILGGLFWVGRSYLSPAARPSPTVVANSGDEAWPTPIASATPTTTATPKPDATATATPTPTPTPTPKPPPPWQELGYLTSIEDTETVVVEHERRRGLGGIIGERILLKTHGTVQMGIDLSQIADDDVEIEDSTITVTLPPVIITNVQLVPDQTQIYDTTGTFLLANYEGLETEAISKAQAQLEAAAANNTKMFELTERIAKAQLENLLYQLGFDDVALTFKE
jgi:hypothetical protein